MNESFFTKSEFDIAEKSPAKEAGSFDDQREASAQPNYCLEKLMLTDLGGVRRTVEYLKTHNEPPFPHPSSKECTKAANVVASSIEFLQDRKEAANRDQRVDIESIDQAIVAMQEVFGDPLEDTDNTGTHPLVKFFNTLSGTTKEGVETVDLTSLSSQSYDLIEQFVGRWEELEDERIVNANRLSRERWLREETESIQR